MSQGARILVVHPDAGFSARIESALRGRSFRVHAVSTLASALAAELCDLVLCALRLQDGSALDLLAALEERGTPCAAILTASNAGVDDCTRAMRAGAREVLLEPYSDAEVLEAVLRQATRAALPSSARHDRLALTARSGVEANARAVRELLAYFVARGFAAATRARVASATSEILENVLRHAYPNADGAFHLEASATAERLRVEVTDDGKGFDPLRIAVAEQAASASGLARARSLAEGLSVANRPEGGARVVLEFVPTSCVFGEERGLDLSDLDYLDPVTARRVLTSLRDPAADVTYHLSPALAVCVGRLLSAPGSRVGLSTGGRS